MRAILQRCRRAAVSWDGGRQEIGPGLAILVAAGPASTDADADRLAAKTAALRIFRDSEGRTNLSLGETGGSALVVSQFTLYADASRGRRPSFIGAGDPERARALYVRFGSALAATGIPVRMGNFGAEMVVDVENDGPFTMAISTDDWSTRV